MDVVVQLTKGYTTVIDAEDADRVATHSWCASVTPTGHVYALRAESRGPGKGYRRVYLHRFLMGDPQGIEVDHIDRDTLNNRRSSNLRLATSTQQKVNRAPRSPRSGFKGVSRHKNGRWEACMSKGYRTHHLGLFDSVEEAARAYDSAVRAEHGEFAWLNFPEEAPIEMTAAD
jgi:hypothetical protein